MKLSVVAQNGSIHFDENEDIEVIQTVISAKNVWQFLVTEHTRFKDKSKIVAIHVVGKNTSATPNIILRARSSEYASGVFEAEHQLTLDSIFNFTGMVDVNWLIHSDNFYDFAKPHFQTVFQYQVLNASFFTGYLVINTYVKGRR